MPEAGLVPTDQAAATGPTIRAGDHTVTELWRALFDDAEIRDRFVRDVRAFVDGRPSHEIPDALDERGVPTWLAGLFAAVGRGDRRAAWSLAADVAPDVADTPTGPGEPGGVDALLATAGLFGTADGDDGDESGPTPVVTVVMGEGFRSRRRDQRVDVCRLLATLADGGVRVEIATGAVGRRFLADYHRDDLPGVSDWCNTHRGESHVSAVVDDAVRAFDPDGTGAEILRLLADDLAGVRAYDWLQEDSPLDVTGGRVRQVVPSLADAGLVGLYRSGDGTKVELRQAGRAYLDRLADERAAQQTLTDAVSQAPNVCIQSREPRTASTGEGEDAPGEDGDGPRPYRTIGCDPTQDMMLTAAGATAESGSVTVVSDRLATARDTADREIPVGVDSDREEVVVSVRATGALQHMVSVARALAATPVIDRVLTDERVSGLHDPATLLRDARCIGALSDDALDDPATLREAFRDWDERLAAMTTDFSRGESDDRGEIMRSAHGLAGSLVHLYDALGFDVVREVRVPGGLNDDRHAGLARSLATATAIQSKYRDYAAYRQLYESRDDKRTASPAAEVDAADPTGELLGSVVVRGPDVHRLDLAGALAAGPGDTHDDAPEFQVPVSVEQAGRDAVASVARRILPDKRIRPTERAVSLLHGLVESPYAVARALDGRLKKARRRRDVIPRDLRRALSGVEPDDLMADLPPTLGKVLAALLRLDPERRVGTSELADLADVSTQSVRNHRETLAALDLVREDEHGLYVAVAPDPAREDGQTPDAYPGVCTGETAFADALDAVAADTVPTDTYLGRVYDALAFPPDPWSLREHDTLGPWVEVVARLVDADPPPERAPTTVAFGPAVEQSPLPGTDDAGGRARADGGEVV